MRILHLLASNEHRGAEVFAADLINALKASGIEQSVAILRWSRARRLAFDAPMTLLGVGRTSGIRLDVGAVVRLGRLIHRWRPDVVQAHGGEALKHAIPAALLRGVPVVYRKIGATPRWRVGPLRRAGYGHLMRHAARVVAVGEAIRHEAVREFGVPPSRVECIPNAVDPRRLECGRTRTQIRRELGLSASTRVVVSVGALEWEKDPVAHLRVIAPLVLQRQQVMYLVAGDGPLRSDVEREIQRHGLDGKVRLLGTRTDIADLMTASDVLLLASRTEGMPANLIEAGMSGLPVVAPAIGSIPEVVVHESTGLLAMPGDIEELRSCVARLLVDDGARRSMGETARSWCRSKFDIGVVAPRYATLYDTLRGSG